LEADIDTLPSHSAQRWDIEVLSADVKELLGIDQYQVMSAEAILHYYWVLVMLAYGFREERFRLQQQSGKHMTVSDARRHA
jgi:hypothetical protein